jgi:outer membrane protein OmpA-like peptidoglycan-associated protein
MVMKRSSILLNGLALSLSMILMACSSTPSKTAKPTATTNKPSILVQAPASSNSAAAAVAVDPYLLKFDSMSAKLTPEHEAQLQRLVPQLKEAKAVVIRGYCNKKEVGNAKAAALARASNVEKFLISQGVSDKKMTLRYTTEDATHAVELEVNS